MIDFQIIQPLYLWVVQFRLFILFAEKIFNFTSLSLLCRTTQFITDICSDELTKFIVCID